MSYQVLSRRLRPRKWEDVFAQGRAVEPVRKALVNGSTPHLYLFSGPKGTGKTTCARILAAALNCEKNGSDGWSGDPCGECDSCVEIQSDHSGRAVIEVDGATNGGVAQARDLASSMSDATLSRYRVVILDEVHAMSSQGQTALLKTMEEPPPWTVFILVTTDPDKLHKTVVSRATPITFHALSEDSARQFALHVAEAHDIEISEDEMEAILGAAEGSHRDILSQLELLSSGGHIASKFDVDAVFEALVVNDVAHMLMSIQEATENGSDPDDITRRLLRELRSQILMAYKKDETVSKWIKKMGPNSSISLMRRLSETLKEVGGDRRLSLECSLLSFGQKESRTLREINDRLCDIEDMIARIANSRSALNEDSSLGQAHELADKGHGETRELSRSAHEESKIVGCPEAEQRQDGDDCDASNRHDEEKGDLPTESKSDQKEDTSCVLDDDNGSSSVPSEVPGDSSASAQENSAGDTPGDPADESDYTELLAQMGKMQESLSLKETAGDSNSDRWTEFMEAVPKRARERIFAGAEHELVDQGGDSRPMIKFTPSREAALSSRDIDKLHEIASKLKMTLEVIPV